MSFKKRIFLLLLSVIFLVCSIPFCAFASDQDINTSFVENDLLTAYENPSKQFPKNTSDRKIYLVSLMENGYTSISGVKSDDYGLYLYIYNPSGKNVISDTNKVQFATRWKYDGEENYIGTVFKKYDLTLLNSNKDNTLIKFKVTTPDAALCHEKNGTRQYDISGIEIHEGNYTYKDYTVGYSYIFSGYGKGNSPLTLGSSTLCCYRNSFLTINVDAHQVSYLTGDSAKGAGYSNQINSVYFSLPSDIEKKYGNLYAINYEYYHYYTNPIIITDNEDSYNKLLADRGKIVDDSWDYSLYGGYSLLSSDNVNYIHEFRFFYGKKSEIKNIFNTYLYFNYLDNLTSVFYAPKGWTHGDVIVSAGDVETYFKEYDLSYHTGKTFDYSSDLFDLEKATNIYNNKETTIDEVFSLESYTDTHNFLERWLDGVFDKNEYDNSIKNAKYIEKVDSKVLTSLDVSSEYFVDKNYITDLKDFYIASALKGENTYLLRYGVADDYYSRDLTPSNIDGNFLMCQGNVYLNFDFISFSFKDGEKITVLAAVSDPSDGFFSLIDATPGGCKDFDILSLLMAILFAVILGVVIAKIVIPVLGSLFEIDEKNDKNKKPKPPKRRY